MNNYFSGIGSRLTPLELYPTILNYCKILQPLGFTLRSGGADGSDSYFEQAYDELDGNKEIFLPWKGFNKNTSSLYEVSNNALKIASKFHSNWSNLSQGSRKLHGRNTYQVLGSKLFVEQERSKFIICWTEGGQRKGGTAQAMRIADYFKIPVFNLAVEESIIKLDNYLILNYGI